MKKYYKLATLLIILCLCFTIVGCKSKKEIEQNKKLEVQAECSINLSAISNACDIYAKEHEGKYPNSLDELKRNSKENFSINCPENSNKYLYISKDEKYYYIIKCSDHKIIMDNKLGIIELDTFKREPKFKNIVQQELQENLNPEELKEIGID